MSGSYETLDETVLSARLALIALPGPVIDEVIGSEQGAFLELTGVGYPAEWPTEDRHVLGLRKRQISEGDDYRWLLRAVVTRSHPTMVGRIGFHGPPDADGVVEIGYRIDSAFRRRGFGFECAARLIEAAERASGRLGRASVDRPGERAVAPNRGAAGIPPDRRADGRDRRPGARVRAESYPGKTVAQSSFIEMTVQPSVAARASVAARRDVDVEPVRLEAAQKHQHRPVDAFDVSAAKRRVGRRQQVPLPVCAAHFLLQYLRRPPAARAVGRRPERWVIDPEGVAVDRHHARDLVVVTTG